MTVPRPNLTWPERLYLPAVVGGLAVTLARFWSTLVAVVAGRRSDRVTMFYPEEKWPVPEGYRGAPTLVRDEEGREKCVACQLCEFICPPRAIRVIPAEISTEAPTAKIEKTAKGFYIDMIRCIYCGMCEEVCPEEAIFLRKDYAFTGLSRADLVHDKARLLELGGVMPRPIRKWDGK